MAKKLTKEDCTIVNFGKYRGKHFSELPLSYAKWIIENFDPKGENRMILLIENMKEHFKKQISEDNERLTKLAEKTEHRYEVDQKVITKLTIVKVTSYTYENCPVKYRTVYKDEQDNQYVSFSKPVISTKMFRKEVEKEGCCKLGENNFHKATCEFVDYVSEPTLFTVKKLNEYKGFKQTIITRVSNIDIVDGEMRKWKIEDAGICIPKEYYHTKALPKADVIDI